MGKGIKLFEQKKIRTHWDEKEEKWYFSVVDVVGILADSPNLRNYWKVLKRRLNKEGNESVTNCNQLKMQSADGKLYKTDVADTEQLLRLIQSIPSPKAELSTRQIAETDKAKGVKQNAVAGKKGGKIAKDARLALENKTGRKVISSDNFLPPSKQQKKLK